MKKLTLSLLILTVFISCGKNSPIPGQRSEKVYYIEPAQTENYSYEFTNRKCSTGTQSFGDFYETCEGLTSEELNNSCAYEDRKALFEVSHCPGDFE